MTMERAPFLIAIEVEIEADPHRHDALQRGRPHVEQVDRGMELSGDHHDVAYEFLSLRPALYAAGSGEVRFGNFKYRALP